MSILTRILKKAAKDADDFDKGIVALTPDRKKRAEEQGYDVNTVYYHATDKFEGDPSEGDRFEFETIKPSSKGKLGPGVYLSPNPQYVDKYVRSVSQAGTSELQFGEGSRVLPVFVRGKIANASDYDDAIKKANELLRKEYFLIDSTPKRNEFDELMASRQKLSLQKSKARDILVDQGFSGFKIQEELVVFEPKNIRSINAQFDPESKESANILKARGGAVNIDDEDIFEPTM